MTIFYRFSGIFLSASYLLVDSLWLNMPVQVEWGFCIVLLASLGIPHGAADHLVAQKLAGIRAKPFNLFVFILRYLSVMIAYGGLWYFFPFVSFIIFIIISVFHFGDIESTFITKLAKNGPHYFLQLVRSFVLGIGILGFILSTHTVDVTRILQNFNLGVHIPWDAIPASVYILCILTGFQKEHTIYFVNTLFTLVIGIFLPILPAFMIYFAGCHSVYSMRVLSRSLEINMRTLFVKLIPFTMLAITMGIIYVFLISPEKWLAHAFIFLSILTLPHFVLMHKINQN